MPKIITSAEAATILRQDAKAVIDAINDFTYKTFKTRGGRLGSGMGSLLEAMWVYYMNRTLQNAGGAARECELAWLQDHEPADFACLYRSAEWVPLTRQGELFRIEAKSMNVGVDEAKGHFTNLEQETQQHDQLLVLIWSWTELEHKYVWPKIHDFFLGSSIQVIRARDQLHLKRGGSFVSSSDCPDRCSPTECTHHGEPLNAAKKRERRTGPATCKPANVEYAANFGGLVRMLKTSGEEAAAEFRKLRREDETFHEYVSFIHKHFPAEEVNQYKAAEWRSILVSQGMQEKGVSSAAANVMLRQKLPNYQTILRKSF
jgi:hypothetical protein